MPNTPLPEDAREPFMDVLPDAGLPFTPGRAIVGMVHVGALPGTPASATSVELLAAQAAEEARVLGDAGFDAIIIENMHDRPYVHGAQDPAVTAAMTRVALEVAAAVDLPLGVQILSGGNRESLAVCAATTASFIRCENFVYSHVADEGLLDRAEAGELLRYRRAIDATDARVLADIKKKHAGHALTADLTVGDCAHAAEFFGADALVVTGKWTGEPADIDDLRAAREASTLPLLVGSGVGPGNIAETLEHADAVIVGSSIKHEGLWSNPVDPARAGALVGAAR